MSYHSDKDLMQRFEAFMEEEEKDAIPSVTTPTPTDPEDEHVCPCPDCINQ